MDTKDIELEKGERNAIAYVVLKQITAETPIKLVDLRRKIGNLNTIDLTEDPCNLHEHSTVKAKLYKFVEDLYTEIIKDQCNREHL